MAFDKLLCLQTTTRARPEVNPADSATQPTDPNTDGDTA
jgi:hypothetical protein